MVIGGYKQDRFLADKVLLKCPSKYEETEIQAVGLGIRVKNERFQIINSLAEITQLAPDIYHLTKKSPSSEQYSLTSQLKGIVVSTLTNIAEGGRRSQEENTQFLSISMGST